MPPLTDRSSTLSRVACSLVCLVSCGGGNATRAGAHTTPRASERALPRAATSTSDSPDAAPADATDDPDDVSDATVERENTVFEQRSAALHAGDTFDGPVSFYSDWLRGHRTANGERYDPRRLTAASRALPFGTILRVHVDARSVIVRVNDRGPFGNNGRVLDLSRAAAQRLGMIHRGVGQAHVEVLRVGDNSRRRH